MYKIKLFIFYLKVYYKIFFVKNKFSYKLFNENLNNFYI